jgi:putative FmdB family regulatory protein
MIYEFNCPCGNNFTEVRRLSERHQPATCAECSAEVLKREIPSRTGGFTGAADWDTAHYNPALGKVVKSYAEGRKEAKRRGMTEIGDEPVEKIHKSFDNQRRRNQEYDLSEITSLGEVNTK